MTEVFVPTEIKIVRDVFTFNPEVHAIKDAESSIGYDLPEEVFNAFYENGYKIRLNPVDGAIQAYIYRYGGYLDDSTIHLAAGESVELRGYADIRKINLNP